MDSVIYRQASCQQLAVDDFLYNSPFLTIVSAPQMYKRKDTDIRSRDNADTSSLNLSIATGNASISNKSNVNEVHFSSNIGSRPAKPLKHSEIYASKFDLPCSVRVNSLPTLKQRWEKEFMNACKSDPKVAHGEIMNVDVPNSNISLPSPKIRRRTTESANSFLGLSHRLSIVENKTKS
uniref:Uncharacterized protein n=1 Tax=Spongospora subterranea TaxID=70186 RepID=A0A0H5R5V8_9EUKA|eukprot:CRZ09508.1 hypothetical protein [Spongospora subterranea]